MDLFSQIRQLCAQRAKHIADARVIFDKAAAEKRDMSAEETQQWEKLHQEAEGLKKRIDVMERQLEAERSLNVPAGSPPPGNAGDEDAKKRLARAYRNYLLAGIAQLSGEDRALMEGRRREFRDGEIDQMTTGAVPWAYAGYTVPELFQRELEVAMIAESELLSAVRILPTDSGASLEWPTMNDTGNGATVLAENTENTGATPPAAGHVTFTSYMLVTDVVAATIQLMRDSAFNIESFLSQALGARMGRGINGYITTGSGSGQPLGLATIATSAVTAAGQAAVTSDEILDLIYAVPAPYRRAGKFVMRDSSVLKLRKLKDGEGRYLWIPGMTQGQSDTLFGYPILSNPDMPAMAAGLKPIVFGDLQKYVVRRIGNLAIVRFDDSAYMSFLRVGFMGYQAIDGRIIDAGTHPIQCITMHS